MTTYFIKLLRKSDWLRESSGDLLCYLVLFLNVVHHVVNIINVPVRWATGGSLEITEGDEYQNRKKSRELECPNTQGVSMGFRDCSVP
jgi:hypothetical protein